MKFYAKDIPVRVVMQTLKEGNIRHTPFNKYKDHKGTFYTFDLLDDTDQHELLTFLILKS